MRTKSDTRVSGHFTGAEKDDLFEILVKISGDLQRVVGYLETFQKEREKRRRAVEETAESILDKTRLRARSGER